MYEIDRSLQMTIASISREPWLFDDSLSDEEKMYWKLKGECHVCRYDAKFHRDDCQYSDVQLHFQQMEKELYNTRELSFYGINSDALKKALKEVEEKTQN